MGTEHLVCGRLLTGDFILRASGKKKKCGMEKKRMLSPHTKRHDVQPNK